MKKVLVTGASGFIGRYAIAQLSLKGYEVHAVSNLRMAASSTLTATWHQANLLNRGEVEKLVERINPTHLLHLAWNATPGKFWTSPENLDWVIASVALMKVFQEQGGQRIVMAGSCAEYDWAFGKCIEDSTPSRPATLYGASKNSTRLLLEAWAAHTKISSAWGRIFFLYGPNEYPERLVPSVINSLLRGEPALCTQGTQIRDFMYVEDVASAFVALLESEVTGVVNMGSGEALPIMEMVHLIADQIGRRDLVRLGAISTNVGDPAVLVADVDRLKLEVGFCPKFSLGEGISLTLESMRSKISREGIA